MSMFVEGYLAEKERYSEAPAMLKAGRPRNAAENAVKGAGDMISGIKNALGSAKAKVGQKMGPIVGNAKDTWTQVRSGVNDGLHSAWIASDQASSSAHNTGYRMGDNYGQAHHLGDRIPKGANPFNHAQVIDPTQKTYRQTGRITHDVAASVGKHSDKIAAGIAIGGAALAVGATAKAMHSAYKQSQKEMEEARKDLAAQGKKNPSDEDFMDYFDRKEREKRKAYVQSTPKGKFVAKRVLGGAAFGAATSMGYAPPDVSMKTSGLAGAFVGGMAGAYFGNDEWNRAQAEKNAQKPPSGKSKRESTGNPLFEAYEEAYAGTPLRENIADTVKKMRDADGAQRAFVRPGSNQFSANRAGQAAHAIRQGQGSVAAKATFHAGQAMGHVGNALDKAGDAVKAAPGAMKSAGQAVAGAVTRHPVAAGAAAAGLGLVGAAALARKAMSSMRDKGIEDPSDDDFHKEMSEQQNGISNGGNLNKNAQGMNGKPKLPSGKKMVFGRVVDVSGV